MNSSQPNPTLEAILRFTKKLIPPAWFESVAPKYHYLLARTGTLFYRFPSKKIRVIAVTGTKGKSTTTELISAILEEAGYKTALLNTIRFKVADVSTPNRYKMTVPGRFFVQQFLRLAVQAKCDFAVMEMSSEAAKQFRHIGIQFDALIFTNLAPEHLESHGGMEKYAAAKLSLAKYLGESRKRPRYIVANVDDKYGEQFLETRVEMRLPFSLKDAEPYTADEKGARFFWRKQLWSAALPGVFNLKNTLAALTLCEALGVSESAMRRGIQNLSVVEGRVQKIDRGQKFTVIVDYAHTPDSLQALYETYGDKKEKGAIPPEEPEEVVKKRRMICVLGSTGGGRDVWKRPAMGKIADQFCDVAYLTDEDPYDESPKKIIDDVAKGFSRIEPKVILNRREAIAAAFKTAKTGDVVLITGKGTDPYIMRARGSKELWSDKKVAEEELDKLRASRQRKKKV